MKKLLWIAISFLPLISIAGWSRYERVGGTDAAYTNTGVRHRFVDSVQVKMDGVATGTVSFLVVQDGVTNTLLAVTLAANQYIFATDEDLSKALLKRGDVFIVDNNTGTSLTNTVFNTETE